MAWPSVTAPRMQQNSDPGPAERLSCTMLATSTAAVSPPRRRVRPDPNFQHARAVEPREISEEVVQVHAASLSAL